MGRAETPWLRVTGEASPREIGMAPREHMERVPGELLRRRRGSMSDERTTVVETTPSYSGALLGAIALAVLAALGGLASSYALSNRITRQEAALSEANQQ